MIDINRVGYELLRLADDYNLELTMTIEKVKLGSIEMSWAFWNYEEGTLQALLYFTRELNKTGLKPVEKKD